MRTEIPRKPGDLCNRTIFPVSHRQYWPGLLCALYLTAATTALAQNTCFTDPHGSTICSTASGVIHGNTNSTGQSIYRDDHGTRLDYESDPLGRSSLQLPSGEPINWTSPHKRPLEQTREANTPSSLRPGGALGAEIGTPAAHQ